MYLVDTSVWLGYMRDEENEVTKRFAEIEGSGASFGIASVNYQEVLQGAASRAKFDYLVEFMGSQTFYHPQDPVESYREAALIYFRCRRAGITIRSATACLIARIAAEHDLMLLHDDRDFKSMAGMIPDLTLAGVCRRATHSSGKRDAIIYNQSTQRATKRGSDSCRTIMLSMQGRS